MVPNRGSMYAQIGKDHVCVVHTAGESKVPRKTLKDTDENVVMALMLFPVMLAQATIITVYLGSADMRQATT